MNVTHVRRMTEVGNVEATVDLSMASTSKRARSTWLGGWAAEVDRDTGRMTNRRHHHGRMGLDKSICIVKLDRREGDALLLSTLAYTTRP